MILSEICVKYITIWTWSRCKSGQVKKHLSIQIQGCLPFRVDRTKLDQMACRLPAPKIRIHVNSLYELQISKKLADNGKPMKIESDQAWLGPFHEDPQALPSPIVRQRANWARTIGPGHMNHRNFINYAYFVVVIEGLGVN